MYGFSVLVKCCIEQLKLQVPASLFIYGEAVHPHHELLSLEEQSDLGLIVLLHSKLTNAALQLFTIGFDYQHFLA